MQNYKIKLINDYINFEIQNLSERQPKITIFGELLYICRFLSMPLIKGENSLISNISCGIGGGAGYISVALKKLNAKLNLMAFAGNDRNCAIILNEISKMGIPTENIKILQGEKTPVFMLFTGEDNHEMFQAATMPGALEKASLNYFNYEKELLATDLLYTCNSLNLKKLKKEILYLVKYAKTKNITTAHEINFRYTLKRTPNKIFDDESSITAGDKSFNDLFENLDILFINKNDLSLMVNESCTVKALDLLNPNITTVVVNIPPSTVVVRHLNKIYNFKISLKNPWKTYNDSSFKYFQSAFLYFYIRKLPIEISSALGLAYEYIFKNTQFFPPETNGIENLLRFVKKYKIFDEGKGSIVIE